MPSLTEAVIRRANRRGQRKATTGNRSLYEVTNRTSNQFIVPGETVIVNAHPQQFEAINNPARFTLLLAGTRSGKTASGPWWLLNQMRLKGPGEYLACSTNYPLFRRGAYKYIRRVFVVLLRLGSIVGGASGEFRFSPEGFKRLWPDHPYDDEAKIVFGHAGNPDSLEAAEYKAAWLDEPGQKGFPLESWEAIQRRLAIDRGPALLTTTPYMAQHWIRSEIYEPAERGDADYKVVSFESIANPTFPRDEYERAKRVLPSWKFDLFYRGRFSRPAGSIYDCFDPDFHKLPGKDFSLPVNWPLYCGVDFGAPNMAATFFYENCEELEGPTNKGKPILKKTGKYVAFAEYRPNESRKVQDHVEAMRKIIGRSHPDICVGGAKSEGQWRSEFAAAGWPIWEPDQPDVEVGISRVYATIAEDRLFVMDTCPHLLDEIQSYSREVDENGEPLDMTIADKDTYHSADSVRYLIGYMERKTTGLFVGVFG